MLEEEDFEEQGSHFSGADGAAARYHVLYFIEMAKLAIIRKYIPVQVKGC